MRQWTPKELFAVSGAYWASRALQVAVQLDLFRALAGGPRSLPDLAKLLACDERALSMLVSALRAMDLVQAEGAGGPQPMTLSCRPELLRLLSPDSPDYVGYIIKHHASVMKNWLRLDEAVQKGDLPDRQSTLFTRNEQDREDFLMGMFNIARQQADIVAGALDLSGRKSLIDVGGGPGTYAIHFCLHNPKLQATIFDLPTTEPFARKTVDRFGLSGRIAFAAGNFADPALPGSHDVAWLSQVIHSEDPHSAADLIKKAGACLRPGGMICVQEFALDDDGGGPEHCALFGLNMLVQTAGGQAYTIGEISAMLEAAGAGNVRLLDVALPQHCRIVMGYLP